jgi:hypothetical protein
MSNKKENASWNPEGLIKTELPGRLLILIQLFITCCLTSLCSSGFTQRSQKNDWIFYELYVNLKKLREAKF